MRALAPPSLLLALALGVVAPATARAQAGFYLTPSVSVAEVYDDNLFTASSRKEGDFISRITPGIQAGYKSTPLTILGSYTFDAEIFAEHPELTTSQARQQALLESRYAPNPLWTLSLTGGYQTTQTAGELNTQTGLEVGRASARRFFVNPTLVHQFDPVMTGTADYAFTQDVSSGIRTDVQVLNLGLDRRFTAQDTGSLGYALRHFAFQNDGTITSHVPTVGWSREVMSRTRLVLRGGANFSNGTLEPEASASITHRLNHGEISFAYAKTQATVIGQAGTVETDSFVATASYQPLRSLQVRVVPSFYRSTGAGSEAKVYRVSAEGVYELSRRVSLVVSYTWSLQQGGPTTSGTAGGDVFHNVVLLQLTVSQSYRVD